MMSDDGKKTLGIRRYLKRELDGQIDGTVVTVSLTCLCISMLRP